MQANLEQLTQPQAAWLLGITARAVRDKADVPRNDDGTYNAQELLEWARGRTVQTLELPDAELEKVLLAVGSMQGDREEQLPAVADILTDLRDRHGDAGILVFADLLIAEILQAAQVTADPAAKAEAMAQQAARIAREQAAAELRIVYRCGCCRKIRRGRKWLTIKVPADHVVEPMTCPNCKGIAS